MAPKPQRRSIRFAIVAVMCLLLGAVTTVGVAWALSYFVSDGPERLTAERKSGAQFAWVTYKQGPGIVVAQVGTLTLQHGGSLEDEPSMLRKLDEMRRLPLGPEAADKADGFVDGWKFFHYWNFEARGWPWVCLWYEWHWDERVGSPHRELSAGAIEVPALPRTRHGWKPAMPLALPYRPLWTGFAANLTVYAGAWGFALFAPRAIRRRFRVSRGMCGSCGYDLRGSKGGPCPECGKEVKP